ncbi:MAG: bifunctional diguanylate cyclase/phosphodiesterase [Thiobacillus sp.]
MPTQAADATPKHKLQTWVRWTALMPWIVFVISLIVTWQLWRNARYEAERSLYSDFQIHVENSSRRITQRMLDYEQVLAGVRGLFAASSEVTRSEFRAFVAALNIEKNFPGVQSVGWVKIIPRAEKSEHIAAMQREGFSDYTILPLGDRALYAVVVYVEPFFGRNTRAFGQDHYAEPVRRATIDQARDLGAVRISGKVKLAQETDRRVQAGFQMAMPVYQTGVPPATLAERRKQFLGLVGSSFRMDDLMRGILGSYPLDNDVDIEIYDGKTISEASLMHNTDQVIQGDHAVKGGFQIIQTLNIAGHDWTLVAHSLPDFASRLDTTKSHLIAGAGVGTGALLGLLAWLLLRGRARALKAALEISASEAKLRSIVDTAMDAVVQMNAEGNITGWSGRANKIFGWSREEVMGRPLHTLIIPFQYRAPHVQGMAHFKKTGEAPVLNKPIETLALRRDGSEFHVELTISMVTWEGKSEFCAFISDITQKKEADAMIRHQANYDPLTKLPNRHMFHVHLKQELLNAQRSRLALALMFIDLDRFKEVNDTLGHNIGDQLLAEVAQRLSASVRKSDIVARLGGDEFTIILSQLADATQVEIVAQNILRRLAEPFTLNNETAYVSASIGITLYPDDSDEVEQLLMNADQAMYVAKRKGRNRFSYFTPSLKAEAQQRLKLINDMRVALAEKQFAVYFHPIIDIKTGKIVKAEALLRWQHPQLGMADQMEIIPVAEETGLIVEIGDWVFREAARWASRWQSLTPEGLQIGINMSPVQFQAEDGHVEKWLDYLQELGLSGKHIVIEITEGVLLHVDSAISEILLRFRNAGVQISIDDFGTGYSALSYLKKFDIDYLKIDLSFIRDLETDPNDRALSEAIIMIAHKLGLKVIAEGVETEGQLKLLAAADCDYAQGYLYTKPIPPEEFEALLLRSNTT